MNQVVQSRDKGAIMESVLLKGDISKLTPEERSAYYLQVCASVGLNPLTKPLEFIVLNGKMTLYALRGCTDQLRSIYNVSVEEMTESEREGVYVVTVKVRNGEGRTDMAKGAVNIANLKGENLANAMMKAETKAKRRATLSLCGLGVLDETEVETMPTEAMQKPVEAKSVFKNASLRNTFVKNVISAFEEAETLDDLETKKALYNVNFEEMRATSNEHDALAVDECARRYAAAKMRIEQNEINRASFGDGFVNIVTNDRPVLPPKLPECQEVPAMFRRVNV